MTNVLLTIGGSNGDVLSGTSVVPGLQELYPGADLTVAALPQWSSLIAYDPRFDLVPYGQDTTTYDVGVACWHGGNWDDQIPVCQCREAGVRFSWPRMYFAPGELDKAKEYDIALCTFTKDPRRIYERFAELAALLADRYSVAQIDNGPCLGVEHPTLTLRQAAATIARSRLLLTIDTGPMQVGIALKHPMLAIFREKWSGPHNQLVQEDQVVSTEIGPEAIADRVHECIDMGSRPATIKWIYCHECTVPELD